MLTFLTLLPCCWHDDSEQSSKANEFYLFVLRLFIATKWIEIIADALVRVL